MDVVFCADRNVLPGLHVAAFSVLQHYSGDDLAFHVFSDQLDAQDIRLLHDTLGTLGRPYRVELHRVDASAMVGYPTLLGSHVNYVRILVPRILPVPKFLYLDVDIACHLDVHEFESLDLDGLPAGFVPEGPMATTTDYRLVQCLGAEPTGRYLNSGVMWVDTATWNAGRVTERCLEYLAHGPADWHEQSALNYVLQNAYLELDPRFNFISNWRAHWPSMKSESRLAGKIVHFLDFPKPWSFLAEWVHPQFHIWARVLRRTAMKQYRSYRPPPPRTLKLMLTRWRSYKKSFKDRLLFAGYQRGWWMPKGVPHGLRGTDVAKAKDAAPATCRQAERR